MQKPKFILEKFNINNTKHVIDLSLLLLAYKEVVPTLHQYQKQLNTASNIEETVKLTSQLSGMMLYQMLKPKIDKWYKDFEAKSNFKNGIYLVKNPDTNEFIGMFGLKVEEIKNGKIQKVSLDSFTNPNDDSTTQETKEIKKGLGMHVAQEYFTNILLTNKHEFNEDASFFVNFLKTNKPVINYMKALDMYNQKSVKEVNSDIDTIAGSMKEFQGIATKCINKAPQNIVRSKL